MQRRPTLHPPAGPAPRGPRCGPARARGCEAHAGCAVANVWLGLLLPLVHACDAGSGGAPPPTSDSRIAELIEVLTPLEKTVTSDITDQRFIRSRELLGELRADGRETGRSALATLRAYPGPDRARVVEVERALLDVAAHAAPEEARPLLESLVVEYGGAHLDLRTEAVTLLAQTSPARAVEILEPLVTRARHGRTMPPQEFLVRAWIEACAGTGRSPVRELADVATNLFMDSMARTVAVKELARHREPRAAQVLQAVLVESTGDAYLRRMAAQGIRDSMPAEAACEVFRRTASREADLNFARFLADLIEKNCAR